MQGRHAAIHMALNDHTRATLTEWLWKQQTPGGLAKRARTVLLLADGSSFAATARPVALGAWHVRTSALCLMAQGLECMMNTLGESAHACGNC